MVPLQDVRSRGTELPLSPALPPPRVNGMCTHLSFQIQAEIEGGSRVLGLGGPLSSRFSGHVFGRAPERRGSDTRRALAYTKALREALPEDPVFSIRR